MVNFPGMKGKPIIEVVHLSKIYGAKAGVAKTTAIDDVSFEIKSGEFVAIVGPSGSGKSTLMHILGTLDTPTKGEYFLGGENVGQLSDNQLADIRNKKIGFVFQSFNLLPRYTALHNVSLPMVYAGIGGKERLERAHECLKMVGLDDRFYYMPNQLSGGQMQRVAIARALSMMPSIILADEPTGNIASIQALEIMSIFQKLNDSGHTIIVITHDKDIAKCAKRTIHIKDGKIYR